MPAIQQAITAAGGQVALAEALGVSQQAVSQWAKGKRFVPPRRAQEIEALYGIPRQSLMNPRLVDVVTG
jgi:DNA-binding transcriptional regulator YdaS (Cro superfamily)